MTQERNRRRNYFIKRKFQIKFILRFCTLLILGSIITATILYLLSEDTATTAFVNSRLSIVSTSDYILPALVGSSLISIIFISIATAFVIMYLSHRIAGPLFKIEKSIKEIGTGDLSLRIHLRTSDEITEIADSLNEMSENFNKRVLEIRRNAGDLSKQIDDLTAQSLPQQLKDNLRELNAKKDQLNKVIDYFKL